MGITCHINATNLETPRHMLSSDWSDGRRRLRWIEPEGWGQLHQWQRRWLRYSGCVSGPYPTKVSRWAVTSQIRWIFSSFDLSTCAHMPFLIIAIDLKDVCMLNACSFCRRQLTPCARTSKLWASRLWGGYMHPDSRVLSLKHSRLFCIWFSCSLMRSEPYSEISLDTFT